MTVLGYWITVVAFFASAAAAMNYYRAAARKPFLGKPARFWLRLGTLAVLLASALLLSMILLHDYSNGYVYSYSSNSLATHFLFSSFYAGQEGSFLFWAMCSVLIALWLMRFTATRKNEAHVMTVYMAVQSFLLLLLIAKSPFRLIWEMFPNAPVGQIPLDGRGLNPLLQNFWMVVHPPVLFIGFAAMAVPFSFAVAGLWKREYSLWISHAFPWVLFATAVLGLGLMLGAYWAYGVLGWGGYWGWDPVENSSLIPWLVGAALLHTMIAQRKRNKFVRTNFTLAILSFFFVVYSTFLTRSGILGDSSVHSFVDPGATVYWLLVLSLVLILASGFGLMADRWRQLKAQSSDSGITSRESALATGSIALLLSAFIIFFGTSLPIVSNSTVEPSFYDTTNLPIAIVISLLIGFALFAQWGVDDAAGILKRSLKSLIGALALAAVLFVLGVHEPVALLFIGAAAFALMVNIEFALKAVMSNPRTMGGKLAHIGLAVMLFGIISTGKFSQTRHLSLQQHVPQQALGHVLTYTGYEPTKDGKYAFHVQVDDAEQSFELAPVMFNAGEQGLMRNPDIKSFLTKDFYLSPVSLDEGTAQADERYTIPKGETVSIKGVTATFVKFAMDAHGDQPMRDGAEGMTIGSVLELSFGSTRETITPIAIYEQNAPPRYKPIASKLIDGKVQLVSMDVGMGSGKSTVTVEVQRNGATARHAESLVVEASIKPYISLLWGGTIIMMAGFILSLVMRIKEA